MATNSKRQKVQRQNYVRDVEIISEQNKDLKKRKQKCVKKKFHCNYLTLENFMENPWRNFKAQYQTITELPRLVYCMAELTVHILVQHKTGEITTGSGFIQRIRRETSNFCPCHECDGEKVKGFAILTVTTVLHVFDKDCDTATTRGFIEESWDQKRTVAKLFYDKDGDDLEKLPSLYGYRMLETEKEVNVESDWCAVECVTHNMDIVGKLDTELTSYMDHQEKVYKAMTLFKSRDRKVIIVGHPHGGPKRISIGSYSPENTEVLKDVRNHQRWCRYNYDNITCCGSSGSPIYIFGQPLCGFGYWFGHPHNHSKAVKDKKGGLSSIGVEHIE